MSRQGLKFENGENYFPSLIRLSGNRRDWIQEEVLRFYESRYGSEVFGGAVQQSIPEQSSRMQKLGLRSGGGNGRTAMRLGSGRTAMRREGQFLGGTVGPAGVGANVAVTVPQPYIPEFASPDRLFFPRDPKEAMKYWRFFYALDPLCGNVIDMYSEMLLSDMEIAGEKIQGEIRDGFEAALENTNAIGLFRWFMVGYLVDGEVIPHLVWDDDLRRWVYLGFQDPMNVRVTDIPFIGADPYLEMEIPPEVRKILLDPSPKYDRFKDEVPPEFLDLVRMGRDIALDTEKNVTFIPKRLSAFDVRGMSVFSRLWRTLMYEDAIFNASIQTARRHAAPVKVVKLGNPTTGWIPGKHEEEKLRQLLAIAETDPHAWLLYHYGISFEAWGTTDRVMGISREWDIIERIKLIALGVSRAFLHGEVTYSSAEKGLQIFLDRLKGMRTFFENVWWYPRFFGIMARENGWVYPTEAEVNHRVRIRRSAREIEEDGRWIVPRIVWQKSLDSQSKTDLVRTLMEVSERLGIKVSRSEVMASLSLDWEEQERKYREELNTIDKLNKEYKVEEKTPTEGEEMGAGGVGLGPGGGELIPAGEGMEEGEEVEEGMYPGEEAGGEEIVAPEETIE